MWTNLADWARRFPLGRGLPGGRCFRLLCVTLILCGLALGGLARPTIAHAQEEPTPEEIRQQFRQILEDDEFRRLHTRLVPMKAREAKEFEWPQWTYALRRWLYNNTKWIRDFFGFFGRYVLKPIGDVFQIPGVFGVLMQALVILPIVALVLLVIYFLLRWWAGYQLGLGRDKSLREAPEEGEVDLPPGDMPTDFYLSKAEELARQGLYREAIGRLILGAMSHAERSEWIRFRRGLTHRDYLRAMRGKEQPYNSFRTMVGIYEPVCFGRRSAQEDHFRASLEGYRTGFLAS